MTKFLSTFDISKSILRLMDAVMLFLTFTSPTSTTSVRLSSLSTLKFRFQVTKTVWIKIHKRLPPVCGGCSQSRRVHLLHVIFSSGTCNPPPPPPPPRTIFNIVNANAVLQSHDNTSQQFPGLLPDGIYCISVCACMCVPYNFIFMHFLLGKMWILEEERRLDDQTGIMSPIVNFLPIV